jgi:hypothetical protein
MNMFRYLIWSVLLGPFTIAIRLPELQLTDQLWMQNFVRLVNLLKQLEK